MRKPPTDTPAPAATAGGTSRLKTEHHRSAGGLVVREASILLISTQNGRRWQLPKGHIEAGESAEQTAVREVREETGVTGRVVAPLPGVEYWYVEKGRLRVHKHVAYFLLEYESGTAADFDQREVSGAEWFSWEEGLRKLSFDNERKAAEQAHRMRLVPAPPVGAAAPAAPIAPLATAGADGPAPAPAVAGGGGASSV